jgi:hypothetical protein
MTIGLGAFMIIFSISMLFWIGTYTLSLILVAVFFLAGVFGVVAGSKIKARPFPAGLGNQRVVVEVRCKSCNALNPETSKFCASCGTPL